MDKGKLNKINVLIKTVKKIAFEIINFFYYIGSLHYIKKNKERVQKKIDNKEVLNVVFVVQYIPAWNKLEPIYSRMKKDERFNPTIVCVPLNIQRHKLKDSSGNDTYKYFSEHGYESINALREDGGWFDLKQLKPDYLFHSRPYNHFMPMGYTSTKIVKYALICNVLYGPNLSTHGQNVTLGKDYFKDCFCYFSFDETEELFYEKRYCLGIKMKIQKCLPYGAIGIEQILKDKREIEKGEFKKTVMWTPRWSTDPYIGGSTFFKYRKTIRKLIEDNPNIFFIFRPHPLMLDNFLKTGEMSAKEIEKLRDFCAKTKNLILDEEKQYAEQFYASDILITDGSGMIPEYFALNKPIMLCSEVKNYVQWSKQMISSCYQIKDDTQLESTFYSLIEGNDSMRDEREKVFNKLFHNALKNSENIIEFLAKRR